MHEICICFHVSRRQIEKFIRLEHPRQVSQISECFGAGTGCGWCVPFLEKIFEHHQSGATEELDLELSSEEYRVRRQQYLKSSRTADLPPAEPEEPPLAEPQEMIDEIDDDLNSFFSGH